MKPTIQLLLLVISFVLLASRCTSRSSPIAEVTPTIRPISKPVNTTVTQVFENVVYDSNYLSNCKSQYPPVYNQQVGFQGIYPGKNTLGEALETFGKFIEHHSFEDGREFYSFDTFNFSTKNGIVEDIVTDPAQDTVLSLRGILQEYGCPDLIIASALDTGTSPVVYNYTAFIYSSIGLRIGFYNYPITYLEPAIEAIFLEPVSPQAYLENIAQGMNSNRLKLVSFEEAIVK